MNVYECNGTKNIFIFHRKKIFVPLHEWKNIHYLFYIRLKKINPMSQRCRAFVFRCAFDSAKFKVWILFACLIFFSSFLWTCLSKYKRKDMIDTMKYFERQTSSTLRSVLYLFIQNQAPYFKAVNDSNLTRLLLKKKRKKKPVKKNAFRSGLPICHELWDIAFIFFSLTAK